MQIGELAKRGGVGVETIRFYERKGLLPLPARRPSGYRVYNARDLNRLHFIRQAKLLGFSLDEIGRILAVRAGGSCPCESVMAMAQEHLRETEERIRRLSRFRLELRRALARWKRIGPQNLPADGLCTLIERSLEPRVPERARLPKHVLDSGPLFRVKHELGG